MSNPFILHPRIFKFIPALTIGTATACFILGLLIVNLHLSWFGILSTEFARTEYILVGAVFILITATANASFAHSQKDFKGAIQKIKEKRYLAATGEIFFGLATFSAPLIVVFGIVFLNINYIFSWTAWLSIISLITFGHIGKLFLIELVELIEHAQSNTEKTKNDGIVITDRLLGQIAFLLIFLGTYSNFMYPYIPPAFAGGKKSPIMLYPTQRGLEISKALSLPLHENPAIVGPVEILTESENEIVILITDKLSGKQQALRLDRKLFDAIQTTTPKVNKE